MKNILHNCICTQYRPEYRAFEEFEKSIIRPRSLTIEGCVRILTKQAREVNPDAERVNVVRIEKFIMQ